MKNLFFALFLIIFLIACSVVSDTGSNTNATANEQNFIDEEATRSVEINNTQKNDNSSHFQLLNKIDQYGNDGFSTHFEGGQIGIGEDDNYLYVVAKRKENFFVSIAKDDQWVLKDKQLPSPEYSSFLDKFFVSGNLVFIQTRDKNNEHVLVTYILNTDGELVTVKENKQLYGKEVIVVNTTEGPGLLTFAKTPQKPHQLTLFTKSSSQTVFLKDSEQFLPTKLRNSESIFFNSSDHLLYFSNYGTFVYDTLAGELLKDERGSVIKTKESYQYITKLGKDELYMIQQSEGTVKIMKYTPFLQLLNENEKKQPFGYWKFITTQQNELHFWNDLEYKHSPSLSLLAIAEMKKAN